MREAYLNKEAQIHRLFNQRRIAYALIERARALLKQGSNFNLEFKELFRSQGKFGAKDRRLYRELVFAFIRYLPWLEEIYRDQSEFMDQLICLACPTPEVRSLYPTLPNKAPPKVEANRRHLVLDRQDHELLELLPEWYSSHTNQPISTVAFLPLVNRPPLWLRVQKDPKGTTLEEIKDAAGSESEQVFYHSVVSDCIHSPADLKVTELPCFLDGSIEIQDISSQVLLQLLPEQASGNWLDACAGAGGKTLQLAKMIQPFGKVTAFDPRESALRELNKRLKRSGYRNVEIVRQRPPERLFDGVLVDAPCSGSGTWRRHPFLMRQTQEKDVFLQADRQQELLEFYSDLVRPGGVLVYCTCSISRYENEEVGERFLASNDGFEQLTLASRFGLNDKGRGITVYPEAFDGDGLHIAAFRKGQ